MWKGKDKTIAERFLVRVKKEKFELYTPFILLRLVEEWKDKTFARGVNRQDIERGAAELGIPLEEHIQTVLTSLQNISRELGL